MSQSRAELRRRIRDNRKKWIKRAIWFVTTVTIVSTLGTWLWDWTGTPGFLE
ncbi:hypothetical protein MO973_44160 [Paenibacillus sp. TRM 82003]|nr:hypothetical protein [Paenibacillus sp. TRM 82003]